MLELKLKGLKTRKSKMEIEIYNLRYEKSKIESELSEKYKKNTRNRHRDIKIKW